MNISIVIPLLNEEESIVELYDWIEKVMQSNGFLYEIIFIDDGSNDSSWKIIDSLAEKHHHVRGIRFLENYGKSQALHAGFENTLGEVIITMDADLQDNPEEIPERLSYHPPTNHLRLQLPDDAAGRVAELTQAQRTLRKGLWTFLRTRDTRQPHFEACSNA